MWVARATGMKVRRYFVGFGPTLWSTRRPNKLGYTEYGVKAVPLGGFCDIAGMTSIDEIAPEDRPYAMYKQKTWKRAAVLFAGPAMNFVVGLVLIYAIAVIWGLPNLHPPTEAMVGETSCVKSEVTKGELGDCEAPSPAAAAGIQAGDVVVKVGDTSVADFDEMVAAVRKLSRSDPVHRATRRDRVHHRRRRHPDEALGRADATSPATSARGHQPPREFGPTPVQPAVRGARHVRVHRRPGRRTGQVAGEDPDQGRRAGALDRRR